MLINCISYYGVSRLIFERLLKAEGGYGYLVSPYLTNSVIALEIALKVVYEVVTKRTASRTHDLESIFNALPKDHRQRILKLYEEISGNAREAFMDTLFQNKDVLRASRYMYEDVPHTRKFRTMERALFACLEYLHKIAPDLTEQALKDEINVRYPSS